MSGLKVTVLACNYTNYASQKDFELVKDVEIKVKTFACGSRIEVVDILRAFRQGAQGVLVAVCAKQSCHNKKGNLFGYKKALLANRLIAELGLGQDLVKPAYVKRQDTGDFIRVLKEFCANLQNRE